MTVPDDLAARAAQAEAACRTVVFAGWDGTVRGLLTVAGLSRYTADYYLEQKYSWWWKLAEVRRPAPRLAAAPAREDTAAGQPPAA